MIAAIAVVAIVVLISREPELLQPRRRPSTLRQLATFFLFLGVVYLLVSARHPLLRHVFDRGAAPAHVQTGPGKGGKPPVRARDRTARFRWEPVVAIGVLLVAGGALLLVRRGRRTAETDQDLAAALASVLDEALADLRAERDPRRAIVAAYARMERLLAAHGLPRREFEAPFEFLGRVLDELSGGGTAVFELTVLFERAKFSHHEIGADLKDEAIDALVAVRDGLARAA